MSQPRQVALFLPTLAGGGAERVMLNLASGIAEQGVPVDLVVVRASGPLAGQARAIAGVQLHELGGRMTLPSIPLLSAYLRRRRPAAIVSALNSANVAAIVAARLARFPGRVVVTVHNDLGRTLEHTRSRRVRVLPYLMRWTFPRAHAIVAVSAGVADSVHDVLGLPRTSIDVIANPVFTRDLLTRGATPPDHPWFASDAPPVVVGVGRLTEQKRFHDLIDAFARVRERRVCRLIILGEGRLRPALEERVRNLGLEGDAALPGFVSDPYPYLRHAAAFVLSSGWEGLPTVLIEALALGTPVVATDCRSGPAEILDGGRLGALVPVGDVFALARAIERALDGSGPQCARPDDVERYTFAAAARAYLRAAGAAPDHSGTAVMHARARDRARMDTAALPEGSPCSW